MYPRLFELPWLGWPINSYGFMIMVGFLLATYVAVRRAREIGVKSDLVLDIGIIAMIFGIIGAKINYLLQYPMPQDFQGKDPYGIFNFADGGYHFLGGLLIGPLPLAFWYWRTRDEEAVRLYSWKTFVLLLATVACAVTGARGFHLWQNWSDYDKRILTSWQSGFVLYGGLIAGLAAGAVYTRMRNASILKLGDIAAPSMMLGLAFGRIGCLLNGCCFGSPCTLPWGLRFPKGSEAADQVLNDQKERAKDYGIDENLLEALPVHPTMIYEALAALAMFVALSWWWRKKKKFDGEVFLGLGVLYPIWRFTNEFLRGDDRPMWGPFSYSQWVSLVVLIGCSMAIFLLRTRPPQAPVKSGLASDDLPTQATAKGSETVK